MSDDKPTDGLHRKPQLCSICHNIYFGFGNNAQPVNDGRCCDHCNSTVVIPTRMRDMGRRR